MSEMVSLAVIVGALGGILSGIVMILAGFMLMGWWALMLLPLLVWGAFAARRFYRRAQVFVDDCVDDYEMGMEDFYPA